MYFWAETDQCPYIFTLPAMPLVPLVGNLAGKGLCASVSSPLSFPHPCVSDEWNGKLFLNGVCKYSCVVE